MTKRKAGPTIAGVLTAGESMSDQELRLIGRSWGLAQRQVMQAPGEFGELEARSAKAFQEALRSQSSLPPALRALADAKLTAKDAHALGSAHLATVGAAQITSKVPADDPAPWYGRSFLKSLRYFATGVDPDER